MKFILTDYQAKVFSNWITKAVYIPKNFKESLLNIEFKRISNSPKGENEFEADVKLINWLDEYCPFAFIDNQISDSKNLINISYD